MTNDTAPQPAEPLPDIIKKNVTIDGRVWLAGVGNRSARVVFITPCVLDEEAKTEKPIGYGRTIPREPRMLECAHGVIFRDLALRNGIDITSCFYVPLIRYLPDNLSHRSRPTKAMIAESWELLARDLDDIKPDIIVCLGKVVFDLMVNFKAKESDIYAAWFYSDRFKCRVYPMLHITQILKPDKHARFVLDFKAVRAALDLLNGKTIDSVQTNYQVIHNLKELLEFTQFLEANNKTLLSVDCEWEGQQHIDGRLRSLQICWDIGQAAYIRFMDDELQYAFDVPYEVAGTILGTWLNQPQVKYIGHHVSADLPWMHHWLKLDWYNKAIFDSEFALQCCDESSDLGLDYLALLFTDLGRYDWDLIWYRKTHPERRGKGYGLVPDDILIPYACKDVDVVFRSYAPIWQELVRQDLDHYYTNVLNPFVTDVFTAFCLNGLPIDRQRMDNMRTLYNWARVEMQKEFQKAIATEAEELLREQLMRVLGDDAGQALFTQVHELVMEKDYTAAKLAFRNAIPAQHMLEMDTFYEHYIASPDFNIRSKPQMQRWLFEVKKFTPIKSTANKAAGMPAVSWDKVKEYPPERQKTFTPASDKQTLEILSTQSKDPNLDLLLELNAIGNICKAFLKEADVDEDTGEVIAEKGLHYWTGSDDAIHLMHSLTETGRPRSWNPNCLNFPSWVHARLGSGVARIIKLRLQQNNIPEQIKNFVQIDEDLNINKKKLPTIRSIAQAKPGWIIVEADYQTAEMRGLAFISGDAELIKLIEDPDTCFAKVKPSSIPKGLDPEDCVCRLSYPSYIRETAETEQFKFTYSANGKIIAKFTEEDLLVDEHGVIVSPKYDMHWGVVELARGIPREVMDKKKDRGMGKTTNFSSSYGGMAASIARKIESDTGNKPTEEEVQAILDAIERRQPRATIFLKEMENAPEELGEIRAASGRKRHCHTLSKDIVGLSPRTRQGQLSALGRECRNYLMQESVGATAARACTMLLGFGLRMKLQGYPMICLYDSVVVHCPWEEREIWQKAIKLYMFLANGWLYYGRVLRYPIDIEINGGWSTAPEKPIADFLKNPENCPTPEHLQPLNSWLDSQLKLYESNPLLSVYDYTQYSTKTQNK